MRPIDVEQGLRVTFPGRNRDFDDGVEVGLALSVMASGANFTMWLGETAIEQVTELAGRMSFQATPLKHHSGGVFMMFRAQQPLGRLLLVHSSDS